MCKIQMQQSKTIRISRAFHAALSRGSFSLICIIALCSLVLASSVSAMLKAAETSPKVMASVQPTEIFEGESTVLTVSIIAPSADAQIDVHPLEKNFFVENLGSTRRTSVKTGSSGTELIRENSIDLRFRITPKDIKSTTIPGISVTEGKQTFTSNPIELKIKEPSVTDYLLIETTVSPSAETYPLRPLEISVNVLVKEGAEQFQKYDPLAVANKFGAPQLTIPWLENDAIEKEAVWDEETTEWLSSLENPRYGFKLNNYNLIPFGFGGSLMNFKSNAALFLPKPEKTLRKNAHGDDVSYWKYSFKRRLRFVNSTSIRLEPATIKGVFSESNNPDDRSAREFYLKSDAVELAIKAIPEQNAPDDYVGVFGKIKMNATLSNSTLSVGEVATLSIELQGYGSFDNVRAPNLESFPQLVESFKTYPPTEESLQDGVVYHYQIRPLKSGSLVIPAISASFFNVETGKFERLQTDPFELDVRQGTLNEQDKQDEIFGNANDVDSPTSNAKRLDKKFVAIGITILLSIALASLLAYGVKFVLVKRAEAIAASNRHIIDVAQRALERGLRDYSTSPELGLQSIRLVFLRLVAKQFNQRPDSITDAEFEGFLEREFPDGSAHDDAISRMRAFLKYSERRRFAADNNADPHFTRDVEQLFNAWVELLTVKVKRLTTIARVDDEK